ncbi:carboxypeptidase-like regulatory domain-containing protein [Chondromyces apiculatus]|nr:carboxypeptidase-like regulatory domain-containing protein [Chondromyces apiculatus]
MTSTTGAVTSVGSGGSGGALPEEFVVSGVVTEKGVPVAGAMVMQGGGVAELVTGEDGAFSITLRKAIPGVPTVVAAKVGYRSRGVEITEVPEGPIGIEIVAAAPPDNTAYVFGDPGTGDPAHDSSTAFCGHCHTTLVAQFQTSAHARATRDPLVQDLYAGTSRAHGTAASCAAAGGVFRAGRTPGAAGGSEMRCYLGGGVLPDLNPGCGGAGELSCDDPGLPAGSRPVAFGGCADCHAAGMDGEAGGRDLLDAVGVAFENGNHCDVCHKVSGVDLTRPPGTGGALLLQRPRERVSGLPGADLMQVMFGPYPDVPNEFMGGSYQPVFSRAEFCAGCHQQEQAALVPGTSLDAARWPSGLPVHSTYAEWAASPWGTPGTPCQFCHMPEVEGLKSSVDVTTEENAGIVFGFLRPQGTIRSHAFRGPLGGSPRLLDEALLLGMTVTAQGGELGVSVQLRNQGAGHALPTGEPMRALVALVRAEGCDMPLSPVGGMTVSDVGGALARGVVGQGAAFSGATLAWAEGAARATPGQVVRVVRPTGVFDDYVGVERFADPLLSAQEKGVEIHAPVGEAAVVAVAGGALTLGGALAVHDGDVVLLGEALAWPPVDGQAVRALAGATGSTFARVLVDPAGNRHVPHHRAVDMVSDNRIPPRADGFSVHRFALADGCTEARVEVVVLYRPVPLSLGRERGAEARDYVMGTLSRVVTGITASSRAPSGRSR